MSEVTTAADEVRQRLRSVLAPVIEERDELAARAERLEAELTEVREALRVVSGVMSRIEGTPIKPGPKTSKPKSSSSGKVSEQRIATVRAFLEAHSEELGEDFTAKPLMEAMNRNGNDVSRSSTQAAVLALYERGLIRRTRAVQGGGFAYALTAKGAASG